MRKRSFPPVADPRTRLLVLGSLPGERSLAEGRYYANPRNQFWLLMGGVIERDLVSLDYEARLQTLLDRGVGLWDSVAEATRPGSLDTGIRDHSPNDIAALAASLPRLRAVAFNGGKSAAIGMKLLAPLAGRLALVPLPSSSPAHTMAVALKAQMWDELRQFVAPI